MRVGLEVSALTASQPTGIARYMRSLTGALMEALPEARISHWYRLSRLRHRQRWWRPAGVRLRTWQGSWWPPYAGLDLFHGLDGAVPDWRRVPCVATLHDLAVFRLTDPETASESFRESKLARYRQMARRADRVIAVSEATRLDAVELLGIPAERTRVVPHGVDEPFRNARVEPAVLNRYGLREGYLLFVGNVSQRKNTERLVRAFAFSRAARGRQLALAGSAGHRSHATRVASTELGLDDRVIFTGHLADRDLPALYAGASALVFPTLYEGFGLPILEAMAAGIPVLCSDRGAAPETGGGLAVTVDPENTDAIAAGIDRVLESPPADPDALKRHAGNFTWQRAALQTAAIYGEIADGE